MHMKMHDIIDISNSIGFPDVFLIIKCNSNWSEIVNALVPGQKASDRPDICSRAFYMKHWILLNYLKSAAPFGNLFAQVSVIEFQKRGLPHVHVILFLDGDSKNELQNPKSVDQLISADIPSSHDPVFRECVL